MNEFLTIDLPAMMAATLATISCALLGNFLVLRRLSLMGDAIAHAVLPGIVIAFLIAGTRTTLPIVIGAALAGLLTTVLVEAVCKLGKVETGASMGVVFSILFALGVLLLEQAAARSVDLDADCVLYGQLEDILWIGAPESWAAMLDPAVWSGVPREVVTLLIVTAAVAAFVVVFFKELRITAFDPGLATTLGMSAGVMHYALMALVAVVAVASFEAVGSILVIAMFICPAATARMLTDRLRTQVLLSVVIGTVSGVGGYLIAAFGPALFGAEHSLSAAGMITVVSGLLLGLAIVFSPSHGVAARRLRRMRLAVAIAREDLLAMLYRVEEAKPGSPGLAERRALSALAHGTPELGPISARLALRRAISRLQVETAGGELRLTEKGRASARGLVRTHRLWEAFLVDELGQRPDHVHRSAMDLEHVTTETMRRQLFAEREAPTVDPHQRPIPEE